MQKARTTVKTLVYCTFKCCVVILYSRIPVGKKNGWKRKQINKKTNQNQGKMMLTRGGNDLRK